MAYHIVTKENEDREVRNSSLKQVLFFLNRDLYSAIYEKDAKDVEENGVEFEEGDFDAAERLLRKLTSGRTITMTEANVGEWV